MGMLNEAGYRQVWATKEVLAHDRLHLEFVWLPLVRGYRDGGPPNGFVSYLVLPHGASDADAWRKQRVPA